MTKRKAITIIFVLILVVVLLAGCSANQPNQPNQQMYAMIRMPDGSIIQGLCSYSSFGYCHATVVIDGVRYKTGAENAIVWKDEGR